MKNDLFTIGPVTIYGYGLMIAIGIILGYAVLQHRARKNDLKDDMIFNLAFLSVISGIVGAKLLFIITQIKNILDNPGLILKISDGFVVYGGLIAGILAGYVYCRKYRLNFFELFDLVIPSVALAQGFGRIGCFLAGCCYGHETDGPLAIVFHQSEFAPNGVRLVPTQLISSGLDFLNFFVLIVLSKRKKFHGQIAGLYIVFYSIGRFILEFFRGDLIRGTIGGISTSQFISILLFLGGGALFLIAGYLGRKKAVDTD